MTINISNSSTKHIYCRPKYLHLTVMQVLFLPKRLRHETLYKIHG
jgi:hypothetical protein